jgi:hypothetical protein
MLALGPHTAVTSSAMIVCITCRPVPTASASSPSCTFSAISPIATVTVSGSASRSSALFIDVLVW